MPLLDEWEPMNPKIPPCPACGSTSVAVFDTEGDCSMFRCDACEHTWEEETE